MRLLGGRFKIGEVIGEGGTARVFRALDTETGATVAIKVLRDFLLENEENVARFAFEAELLSRFDHPNILPLIARGVLPGGSPWFACAYAAKGSIADRMLREGTIEARRMLSYVVEILDALHYLHQQGIVHRDVKPENILVNKDNVAMLSDFGIALSPTRRATRGGDRMGTPSFMPPEQYEDPRSVTPQADLFGVGVTLFVALTGQTGMLLLVDRLRAGALAGLPPGTARLVERATSLRLESRYRTAWEMSLDVADALDAA